MNRNASTAPGNKLTRVDSLGRKAYRLAESPDFTPGELEQAVLRLHRGGESAFASRRRERERQKYRLDAARAGLKHRADLPTDYEENPLDDQEKLDEIRRQVFGSAPK